MGICPLNLARRLVEKNNLLFSGSNEIYFVYSSVEARISFKQQSMQHRKGGGRVSGRLIDRRLDVGKLIKIGAGFTRTVEHFSFCLHMVKVETYSRFVYGTQSGSMTMIGYRRRAADSG